MAFSNKAEIDRAMRDVLKKVGDGILFDDRSLSDAEMLALKECADDELVEGVSVSRAVSGRIIVKGMYPRVTRKGLEFLDLEGGDDKSDEVSEQKGVEREKKKAWYKNPLIMGLLALVGILIGLVGVFVGIFR